MYFLIEDDELFKKYNDIWNKVINSIKKNLITNPSTIKMSENSDEAKDFHDEDMPSVGSNYICLTVILINFVLKKDEDYYKQVF